MLQLGLDRSEGGTDKAASATEGMDGTRKYFWYPGFARSPDFFYARSCFTVNSVDHQTQTAQIPPVKAKP